MSHRIYFDHNATSPIRPEVREVMIPYLTEKFGNPTSMHQEGQKARAGIEEARGSIAKLISADDPSEIVFTSCGTESNNFALQGVAFYHRSKGNHIITSQIEHSAILRVCQYLEKVHNFKVTYLPVDQGGLVGVEDLKKAITPQTILVTIMLANNEIGTLQPIRELASASREKGILFHTDAVQGLGKIPVQVNDLGVDLLSLSGHKIGSPKGVGVLYIRRGAHLHPLLQGGSHEKKRRAGTENAASIVAFGVAADLAERELDHEPARIQHLRDRLEDGLLSRIPGSHFNGHRQKRLGNTLNLRFDCVEAEGLAIGIDLEGIACSIGSACATGQLEPSHVLTALGLSKPESHGSIRFSLGKTNTEEEVTRALEIIPKAVQRLRDLNPFWKEHLKKMNQSKVRTNVQ